jgi:membrane carboxypeptidase/penicillin-binding protein PbpC
MRFTAALLALALVLPVSLFIGYDLSAFQSRKAEISTLLSQATHDERQLSPQMSGLVRVSTGGNTTTLSARILIEELRVPQVGESMFGWHATSLLWWAYCAIHLSEQERLTLIASRSWMGNGRYGYSAEALARFQRPLSSLSLAEAATLVALAHSPSLFASSPERLARRRDWLLRQMQNDP